MFQMILKLDVLVWLLSYLVGSISFAILVSKSRGLDDPRFHGSKNPGATNVMRTGDLPAAFLTLFGDASKGFLVIFSVKYFLVEDILASEAEFLIAGSMLAVLLGHIFPIFFKFKGGKGVATSGGILIGLDGFLGISVLCVWIFVYCLTNISFIAALSSALATVFLSAIIIPISWTENYEVLIFATWIISLILFVSHHSNIQAFFKK